MSSERESGSIELGSTMGAPAAATDETLPDSTPRVGRSQPPESAPAQLGAIPDRAYLVGRELARGGMGRVLEARDRRLNRDVALKTLRADGPAMRARFEREVFITARLQHPSIVRVYEAGVLPDGEPFFAMEKVRGRPLDQVIAKTRDLDERLALLPHVIAVAEAMAYAHTEGIIHRDLKPSNVLIGSFGETVVIDWGLAKDLHAAELAEERSRADGDSSDDSLTRFGAVLGTPAYMSPEQARGQPADERSDVYAVGALMYTLLAGKAPFRGASSDEVIEQVARSAPEPLAVREPGAPAELCTIVERAMALEPGARYASARELVEELLRFQTGQLVASHEYSTGILLYRWVQRHRAAVIIAGVSVAVLAVMLSLGMSRIVRERDRADAARRIAETASHEAEVARRMAERRADELVLDQAVVALAADPSTALAWLKELSDSALGWPRTADIARRAGARGVARQLDGHGDDVELLALLPDGRAVAASDDGTARIWDLASATARPLVGHNGPIDALAVDPSGTRIATGGTDHGVWLWDAATSSGRRFEGHTAGVEAVAFSADGARLASTSSDGQLRLWSIADGSSVTLLEHRGGLRPALFTADGGALVVGTTDGMVLVVGLDGRVAGRAAGHADETRVLALSPDGTRLASGGEDGVVVLWRLDGGQLVRLGKLGEHADVVRDLVFTPDGRELISAGGDHDVRIYDLARGATRVLEGNTSGVKDLALSPDGRRVASAGIDGVARVWPIEGGPARELRGHAASVKAVVFTADGDTLISSSDDDSVRVWPLTSAPVPAPEALRAWLDARTNLRVAGAPE